MAKTFTQKELVSNNLGGIDHEPGDTAEEDQQIHELIDRFKNLPEECAQSPGVFEIACGSLKNTTLCHIWRKMINL